MSKRTILLEEIADQGWTVHEDGRRVQHLDAGEMLWVLAHLLTGSGTPPFGGLLTTDEIAARSYRRGVIDARHDQVPPHKDPDHLPLPSEIPR